jgi:hypothetical protein
MGEWERDGFLVLRGAASEAAIGEYAQELAADRSGLLVREPGAEHVSLATQATEDAAAVDPYAISPAARTLLLPEALTSLLHERYGEAPLLFDATGSQAADPGIDRDATFVALAAEPETLVTAAVALGPQETTVIVFPGSQTIATTPFSGRYAHYTPERDGEAALAGHRDELQAALGDPDTITLHQGDVLVWSAGLVHGPVTGLALVAHFCPIRVAPGWFAYRPERAQHARHDDGRAWIATQYYDLVDATAPEAAPQASEIERVEDALREHDVELATEPQPGTQQQPSSPASSAAPRRSGGLVNSVRGILGRRDRR